MTSFRYALASLALCVLLSSLGTSIANVALPALSQAFDAPMQHTQWAVVAYLLAITTMVVGIGRLADLYGRRRLLLAGIAVYGGASVVCAFAPVLAVLLVARAAQGIGAAAMMALALPFVSEIAGREKTGRAMGLLGTSSAIGTALGPSLGGVLVAMLGWRAVFLAPVPFSAAAGLLAWRALPADRRVVRAPERVDAAGMFLLAATLASYALAFTAGCKTLLLVAAAGLAIFVRVESRVAAPLLRLEFVSDRARASAFVMNAVATTVVMATLVVGPFYLTGALGLEPAGVGLVLSVGPIIAALAGVPSGALVDRFSTRTTTVAALLAMLSGCAVLALMPVHAGVPAWIASLILITAGYALFQAANNTSVMAAVDADQRGVVSGLLNLSRNLGLVTGASLMGAIFAAAGAPAAGLHATFRVAAGLVAIALTIAYAAGSRPAFTTRQFGVRS